jgi:hypothetical protein
MDIDRNDGSIRQWEFGNQRSQLWDIEVAANGYVYIRSAENGMLLYIAGGNPRDEARLILAPPSGSQSQLWTIDDAGEGLFRITSRFGKCIDVQRPRGTTESTGNCGGRLRNMRRNLVSRWSQTFPAGIAIGITAAATTTVRREEKKEPSTKAIVLECRMPARPCDAPTPGTKVNSMPTSRTPSSKATTMGTTAAAPISAKCSQARNRVTTRATVMGVRIISRQGILITRDMRIVSTRRPNPISVGLRGRILLFAVALE